MITRRELLKRLGVGTAVSPFLGNLPSLAGAAATTAKQRTGTLSADTTLWVGEVERVRRGSCDAVQRRGDCPAGAKWRCER